MAANDAEGISESELLQELREVGYDFGSLADLRTSGQRYRNAIPVLLSALSRANDPRVKGEIVRALSVPWARPAATPALIAQFREVDDETGLGLRWTIGNALEVVWDDSYFDDLVALSKDVRYGRARQMVVLGFRRSKRPDAGQVLIPLLDDPAVSGHVVKVLRKLKVPDAREGLERMLDHEQAWVRKEARAALAALV